MRIKLLAGVVVLHIVFFIGWAVREEMRLLPGAGISILVRTAPVDPRDLLSGQYMRLRYEFSRPGADVPGPRPEEGHAVWVVLQEKDGFYVPVSVWPSRPGDIPAGCVAIRGVVGQGGMLEFGVDRYYVPEGVQTPSAGEVTVLLRIGDDYRPRIDEVFVKGKPWPNHDKEDPWEF